MRPGTESWTIAVPRFTFVQACQLARSQLLLRSCVCYGIVGTCFCITHTQLDVLCSLWLVHCRYHLKEPRVVAFAAMFHCHPRNVRLALLLSCFLIVPTGQFSGSLIRFPSRFLLSSPAYLWLTLLRTAWCVLFYLILVHRADCSQGPLLISRSRGRAPSLLKRRSSSPPEQIYATVGTRSPNNAGSGGKLVPAAVRGGRGRTRRNTPPSPVRARKVQ